MTERLLRELLAMKHETEWLEFKTNLRDRDVIGEYISALSNAAALSGVSSAYLIWGIEDKTHKVVGTSFDFDEETDGESLKHYLSRNLNDSSSYRFWEFLLDGKRTVVLKVSAARLVPTEWKNERYVRIGSSKERLRKFPSVEAELWGILISPPSSIVDLEAKSQDLGFSKLLVYYASRDLPLKENTFRDELFFHARESGKYNLLAYLMADKNDVSVRVAVYSGTTKSTRLYAIRDFGRQCMLYAIDKVLEYCDVVNVLQSDETDRLVERHEVPLFDSDVLREAVLNAFIHNDWSALEAPIVSIFSDRIEILSNGGLPRGQTLEGFYEGKSKPRCRELSDIFLQLRISERSGRGVNKIVERYGKDSIKIGDGFVKVTIPFERVNHAGKPDTGEDDVSSSPMGVDPVLKEMERNPTVTTDELTRILSLGRTSVQKRIKDLRDKGLIRRVGSRKKGYWGVI